MCVSICVCGVYVKIVIVRRGSEYKIVHREFGQTKIANNRKFDRHKSVYIMTYFIILT